MSTGIQWTEETFNPWWGCAKVSPACQSCYADTLSSRYGHDVWGVKKPRRLFGDKHWQLPLAWNRRGEQRGRPVLVFCASMADVFEEHHQLPPERERLWALIAETPWVTWQLLSKRPENMMAMVPPEWAETWPVNVWIGTSVENQRYAEERIPVLLDVPGATRFLSCEPLLGPIDLTKWLWWARASQRVRRSDGIHWVIGGGESAGKPARALVSGREPKPEALAWVRALRDQVVKAGVPFFWKQWGGRTNKAGGRLLDGREWSEIPEPVPAQPTQAMLV